MITSSKILRDAFVLSLIISILSLTSALYLGSNIVFAATASDSVVVTLTVDAGIAISDSADTSLSPNISMANNSAIGESTWTVTTNNLTGYSLTVRASTNPAMKNASSSISDATTTASTWSVASGTAQFGFSAHGSDVVTATWGTDSSCGSAGAPSASLKYSGFTTSESSTVATSNTTTGYAGTATTVCYAAEQKAYFIPSGVYTATVTATAVTI